MCAFVVEDCCRACLSPGPIVSAMNPLRFPLPEINAIRGDDSGFDDTLSSPNPHI